MSIRDKLTLKRVYFHYLTSQFKLYIDPIGYYLFGRSKMMKFAQTAARFALMGAVVFGIPNLAQAGNNQGGNGQGGNGQGGNGQGFHGAPGPVAGAGLPFLVVGYGVYWLIKRRRKAD
jgi:hypothetical protein